MAARVAACHPALVWWCPQLPPSPQAAMELIDAGVANWPAGTMAVIGSSLGWFYATAVANKRQDCKAVLLNPAVDPARDLVKYIGEQSKWQNPDEHFFFEARFIDELRALHTGPLTRPQDMLAIIAKGDEVLDWHEMAARYVGAQLLLLEAGDHALSDFPAHLPGIFDFLALA